MIPPLAFPPIFVWRIFSNHAPRRLVLLAVLLLLTEPPFARAASPGGDKSPPNPQEHWAFRAPVRPVVPQFAARNPIDAFLEVEHRKVGLTPLPPAEKGVLLRRVYLDLVGVPPTREELRAFLADPRRDAYERVVGRLLDDPRHGERWARHWMDVWRYSDWFGRRMVPDVWNSAPQIWRWRDWIVRSLNTDKGYDRMIHEMLAADEVAPGDDDAVVATGYLVRNWYALNPNQWMRDNVEHTGKAFLGLTFNCAHCHDHKYDPITQQDYFGFRAFFEPIYVRQDRLAGEADPGKFQDYDYSSLRKIVRTGLVRVFDQKADAPTWFYTGGDERNRLTNRPPVRPAMPAFLGGERAAVNEVALPLGAFYPGLRAANQETELAQRREAIAAAETELAAAKKAAVKPAGTNASADLSRELLDVLAKVDATKTEAHADVPKDTKTEVKKDAAKIPTVTRAVVAEARLLAARAELASVIARIAADSAKFGTPPVATNHLDSLARAASRAEREAAVRANEARLAAGKLALAQVEALALDDKTRAAAIKTAGKTMTDAETALAAAKVALGDEKKAATYTPLSPVYPAKSTGRRRALAEWIGARENPLTARVAVNHVWAWHFHEPLVRTVYDFGRFGARPTHPELLDWLAVEFMESGWSLKHLHRLVVLSDAYRRSSGVAAGASNAATNQPANFATAVDSENRLLTRMNIGRMEAEVVRDSILHLAGELDGKLGGQELETKDMPATTRRSLYYAVFPELGGAGEFTGLFDAPDPNECYRRSRSIVPQQALALTNSKLVHDHSANLARRLRAALPEAERAQPAALVTAAFEQVLNRLPSAKEQRECEQFLLGVDGKVGPETLAKRSEALIRVLLSHHDFLTIR